MYIYTQLRVFGCVFVYTHLTLYLCLCVCFYVRIYTFALLFAMLTAYVFLVCIIICLYVMHAWCILYTVFSLFSLLYIEHVCNFVRSVVVNFMCWVCVCFVRLGIILLFIILLISWLLISRWIMFRDCMYYMLHMAVWDCGVIAFLLYFFLSFILVFR